MYRPYGGRGGLDPACIFFQIVANHRQHGIWIERILSFVRIYYPVALVHCCSTGWSTENDCLTIPKQETDQLFNGYNAVQYTPCPLRFFHVFIKAPFYIDIHFELEDQTLGLSLKKNLQIGLILYNKTSENECVELLPYVPEWYGDTILSAAIRVKFSP